MPRRQLTDRFCDHAKTNGQQIDYFDEAVAGLALRVSPTKKAWTWLYTQGGKRKRLTFATYPATSLAGARAKVELMRQEIEAGRDPLPQAETFKAICEEYLRRCRLRTKADRQRCLERLVWPVFGSRPIGEIRRSEIVRLLDGIEDANGSVMADRTLALVRTIMNYHASRSDEFRSPIVKGMARTRPKERQRERILSDDELRKVWATSDGVFGAFVRFILLTAARRNEAAGMTWAEIDGRDWTLPAKRNKAKVDLVRPLSDMALAVLGSLLVPPIPAAQSKPGGLFTKANNGFVFTTDGVTPISGFSKFKRGLDKASGTAGWTLHDLRRTARSLMSRCGVSPDVAERCLGHVIGGVRGIYDRHEYHAEKKLAFEKLAAQVDRIINPVENVVAIRP